MSLHRVDKALNDRSKPDVNSHDMLADYQGNVTRPAHGTLSVNYVAGNLPTALGNNLQSGIGQLVITGTVEATCSGSAASSITTVEHNLGYAPYAIASINDAVITGFPGPVSLLLPTWTSYAESGGIINFTTWMSLMVDSVNLYIYIINATSSDVNHPVTYFLYRQPVNTSFE